MSQQDRESLVNFWHTATSPTAWKIIGLLASVMGAAGAGAAAGAHLMLTHDIAVEVGAERRARQGAFRELAKAKMSDDLDRDQRFGWNESQIIDEVRSRVRLAAALAEPDRRRHADAANAAANVFEAALRDSWGWPCESNKDKPHYRETCVTPEHAARIALATELPRSR